MDSALVLAGTVLAVGLIGWTVTLIRASIASPRQSQGPPTDTEQRLVKLEAKTKSLEGEWENKLIQYDTLVRRIVRQKVISEKMLDTLREGDGAGASTPATSPALTRSQLLADWRRKRAQ